MKKLICKCGNDTYFLEGYYVNGGGCTESICTKCGDIQTVVDDYNDMD